MKLERLFFRVEVSFASQTLLITAISKERSVSIKITKKFCAFKPASD